MEYQDKCFIFIFTPSNIIIVQLWLSSCQLLLIFSLFYKLQWRVSLIFKDLPCLIIVPKKMKIILDPTLCKCNEPCTILFQINYYNNIILYCIQLHFFVLSMHYFLGTITLCYKQTFVCPLSIDYYLLCIHNKKFS